MKCCDAPTLPPLNAEAFEGWRRGMQSFLRAPPRAVRHTGAVSHQVKALEAELAISSSIANASASLSPKPKDYLTVVRDALDRIAVGTERLLQRQNAGVLTISTSPDFAAKWLVHRLGHFAEAHSGIDLRVSATLHHVDFAREEVDLAVRHGEGNWLGLDTGKLSAEQLFAVCSPKLLSGRRRLSSPADILKYPLIHMDSRTDWSRWLQAAGVDDANIIHGPVLNRASMVIDAAINGQGIALARTTLAAWDLINGRLVRPFPEALRLSKTYWIICPKATAALPKIVTFRDWLLEEASRDLRQLKKLGWSLDPLKESGD
jgi:LysR family glycine cleavage system transcriptional activator